MHSAAHAYSKTAQTTTSPRELEAQLLLRAAARLQAVADGAVTERQGIRDAVAYNRKLWTLLVASATAPENPLPAAIKQNLGNLGIFVLNRCLELELAPAADRVGSLININRQIAAGLAGRG